MGAVGRRYGEAAKKKGQTHGYQGCCEEGSCQEGPCEEVRLLLREEGCEAGSREEGGAGEEGRAREGRSGEEVLLREEGRREGRSCEEVLLREEGRARQEGSGEEGC